jgi:ketosteroid isomerase-like protein
MSMKHLLSLAFATLLTASVLHAAPEESGLAEEINALCEKYAAAYKAKDASTMASFFIGGNYGVLMTPNAPAAIGSEAIKSRYQSFFDSPRSKPTGVEKLEVGGDLGDWAALKDLVVITASNSSNKYLIVVVREPDQHWRIARLIWNSNE